MAYRIIRRTKRGYMVGLTCGRKLSGRRIKTIGYLLLSALAFAATGLANTPPPVINEPIRSMSESATSWRATSKPSDGLTMGKMQIQFEATTLSEVMSSIKAGSIQHQGDATESVYWLCYTAHSDGYNVGIWIEASDEMGGPENRITDIAVQRITQQHPQSDCPVLPKIFMPLSFGNGVWLGASEATVKRTFPTGLLRSGEQAFVGFQEKVSEDGHCGGGYDLLNELFLTFEAGDVVAIHAGQVTSC